MKVTMRNKDAIAREIADMACSEKDDTLATLMFRVSDALAEIGVAFGQFRTLACLANVALPRTDFEPYEDQTANDEMTYKQGLDKVLAVVY